MRFLQFGRLNIPTWKIVFKKKKKQTNKEVYFTISLSYFDVSFFFIFLNWIPLPINMIKHCSLTKKYKNSPVWMIRKATTQKSKDVSTFLIFSKYVQYEIFQLVIYKRHITATGVKTQFILVNQVETCGE